MASQNNIKQNFTAGEVSDLMYSRSDFERYKNGCREVTNMLVKTQGPATRRSGFQYIASLNGLGIDTSNPKIRLVPFIFNRVQSYVLIFFEHTSGVVRVVFATDDGLVAYPDPPPTECPSGTPISVSAGDIVYIDMPSGWDIDQFDYAQSGDLLYIAQPDKQPHTLTRHGDYCWTVEALTFTAQPSDWSAVYGYPETVAFFQQRLLFGGNYLRRQTIWCSRAGDFSHFGQLGATLVDADAITFTLDSGYQNQIQWMAAVKSLHVGTIGNEWTVKGNNQTAITPGGVLAESPTNNGSEKVKPIRVGLTTMFVELHGRLINEFVYDYTYDSFKTTDITVLAPHLTEDYSIKSWAYQQTPDSVVWAVREDGTMLGLTYQRQHNVVAWHQHTTQGEFLDVATIPGNGRETEVWVATHRVIGTTDVYYIEKKAPAFRSDVSADGRFLDCHLVYDGSATDTVTGLDHLEGMTVSVLADGKHHQDVVVDSGAITLTYSASVIVVGLPYKSKINPLLVPYTDSEGYTEGRKTRIYNIKVRLKDTNLFSVGTFDPEGNERVEEKVFRQVWMDNDKAVPLFSGMYSFDFLEGWDEDKQFWIEQESPLPLTILGIAYKAEVN